MLTNAYAEDTKNFAAIAVVTMKGVRSSPFAAQRRIRQNHKQKSSLPITNKLLHKCGEFKLLTAEDVSSTGT